MSNNFISLCANGDVLPEEINDFIDQWHKSDTKLELHEFLGMSWEEYSAWAIDKSVIKLLITSRIRNVNYKDLIKEEESLTLAARSINNDHTKKLIEWLKRSQYL